MTKIRSIQFKNHPVLENLQLNFTLPNGKTADTIIIAGENGAGKSILLDSLFQIITGSIMFEAQIVIEKDESIINLTYSANNKYDSNKERIWAYTPDGDATLPQSSSYRAKYGLLAIYVDTGINYRASNISNVTSLNLDENNSSRRTTSDIATIIEQTLVDIDTLDNSDLAEEYKKREEQGESTNGIKHNERIGRFSNAFNSIFDGLSFKKVANVKGHKTILFQKYGKEISIHSLSSGEKQIIYRGGFLLKDKNATKGAIIFIDEPETALHPNWQKQILHFYQNIFTDKNRKQTSQIFVVTHSPFIIHNNQRINDKVIVLTRDNSGAVHSIDSPEYYYCSSVKAIEDAFNITDFRESTPTIYLEGRTDELYFKKALDLSGITNFPFRFKWIGHTAAKGKEENTGKEALNKAYQFLISQNPSKLNICLADCDTHRDAKRKGNVIAMSLRQFPNHSGVSKGIENSFDLTSDFVEKYLEPKEVDNGFGKKNIIYDLKKMEMCDQLCNHTPIDSQKEIFANLISELDNFCKLYKEWESEI